MQGCTLINFYAVLGVRLFCSENDVLKRRYHELAKLYHPDKNPHSKEESTKKFQEIHDAYETLSNEITKSHYDHKLKDHMKPATVIVPKAPPKAKLKNKNNTPTAPPVWTFSYQEQGAYGAYVSINQKKTNLAQYKRLIDEIVDLPHTKKLEALKKIKRQLNYFYDKNEKKTRYETLLFDLKSRLTNSLHYSYASINDSRYHFFHITLSKTEQNNISFDLHGLSGDALKTAILTHFKASIQDAASQKDLIAKVDTFKNSMAYNKLATGQGLITTMFRLKTSSVVALDQIVEDARKRLEA